MRYKSSYKPIPTFLPLYDRGRNSSITDGLPQMPTHLPTLQSEESFRGRRSPWLDHQGSFDSRKPLPALPLPEPDPIPKSEETKHSRDEISSVNSAAKQYRDEFFDHSPAEPSRQPRPRDQSREHPRCLIPGRRGRSQAIAFAHLLSHYDVGRRSEPSTMTATARAVPSPRNHQEPVSPLTPISTPQVSEPPDTTVSHITEPSSSQVFDLPAASTPKLVKSLLSSQVCELPSSPLAPVPSAAGDIPDTCLRMLNFALLPDLPCFSPLRFEGTMLERIVAFST